MPKSFVQGVYTLKHPEKYVGNPNEVVYRSSWELAVHAKFDTDPNVLKWGSEVIPVPYLSPKDNRIHNYFPDYIITFKDASGKIRVEMVEVKPAKQLVQPVAKKGKRRQSFLIETLTYAINMAKFEAARRFCQKHGMTFRILTENNLV